MGTFLMYDVCLFEGQSLLQGQRNIQLQGPRLPTGARNALFRLEEDAKQLPRPSPRFLIKPTLKPKLLH